MRSKYEPKRQLLVNVTLITDRYGAAACATLLCDTPIGPLVTGTGIAKKEPHDVNDPVIAMNLAAGEALRDLGTQMLRTGEKQVQAAVRRQEKEAQERVRAALQRSNIPAQPPRALLPLAVIEKEWGRKAAKKAAGRRGVEWPPKRPKAKK